MLMSGTPGHTNQEAKPRVQHTTLPSGAGGGERKVNNREMQTYLYIHSTVLPNADTTSPKGHLNFNHLGFKNLVPQSDWLHFK